MPAGAAVSRYLSLFREQRHFRTFWAGFAASVTADEITRIAQILAGLAVLLALPAGHWVTMAVFLLVFGVCTAPLTIWVQTLRMAIVPAEMHGRAFAFLRMLMQSGRPIGGTLAGIAVNPGDLTDTIVLSALLVGAPSAVGLCLRDLRKATPRA